MFSYFCDKTKREFGQFSFCFFFSHKLFTYYKHLESFDRIFVFLSMHPNDWSQYHHHKHVFSLNLLEYFLSFDLYDLFSHTYTRLCKHLIIKVKMNKMLALRFILRFRLETSNKQKLIKLKTIEQLMQNMINDLLKLLNDSNKKINIYCL